MVTIARRSIVDASPDGEGSSTDGQWRYSATLLDALPDGIILFDADEHLVFANRVFRMLFPGLDDVLTDAATAETLFAAMTIHLAPAGVQGTSALLDERLRHLREPSGSWRQFLADGRIAEIEDRVLPCGGRLASYRDVTRQVHDFSHLSQRLSAVEAMEDGIAILDGDARLEYMNRAMVRLLEFDDAQSRVGRSFLDLLGTESARTLQRDIVPALANIHHWRGEVAAIKATGDDVPLEISITQLDEGGAIVVARSLVEQKASEAERARLQAQFFGAQKMEALGTLASSIAHDFNNMLTSIMGYATFLTDDLPGDGQQAGFARNILTASERAQSLVAQILAFSRRGEAGHTVFAPASVMRETATFLRSMLPPRIDLVVEIDDETLTIVGDATQIGQVIMNLAVNARDAIPKQGGKITLALAEKTPPKADRESDGLLIIGGIARADHQCSRWVCISVRDTGGGMSPDTMDRVFEPFFTTKGDGGGTGLGLAAVRGIAVEHGGGLVVSSAPGEGSEFSVYLPAADRTPVKQGS